ncbi:hypothetical protein [Gracilibacillus phocaeensis]|uniref:hypothetical protein n=1 Tax=Gracilibacillus phocaeensis TaxID=2042304 RepID=UPI001030A76A|nr:hypothetical protein [Gracilibacillus phocaeensis]
MKKIICTIALFMVVACSPKIENDESNLPTIESDNIKDVTASVKDFEYQNDSMITNMNLTLTAEEIEQFISIYNSIPNNRATKIDNIQGNVGFIIYLENNQEIRVQQNSDMEIFTTVSDKYSVKYPQITDFIMALIEKMKEND